MGGRPYVMTNHFYVMTNHFYVITNPFDGKFCVVFLRDYESV